MRASTKTKKTGVWPACCRLVIDGRGKTQLRTALVTREGGKVIALSIETLDPTKYDRWYIEEAINKPRLRKSAYRSMRLEKMFQLEERNSKKK